MTAADWTGALDALEERVRHQEAVVRGRSAEPPAGGLPVVTGPIPEALVPRAMALLEHMRAVEVDGRLAMDRMRASRAGQRPGNGYGADRPAGASTTRL